MAKKKKKNNQQPQTQAQAQPQRQQPPQQQQHGKGDGLSPKERYEARVAFKQSVATDDEYKTIRMRTPETSETRNFITILDNLMYDIRMSAGGKGSRIKSEDLTKYINRVQKAKDELNLVCAELSRSLGKKYRPPRGYDNPLEKRKQQQQAPKPVPPQQQNTKQSAAAKESKAAEVTDSKQAKQAKQAAKKATTSTLAVPADAVATPVTIAATA